MGKSLKLTATTLLVVLATSNCLTGCSIDDTDVTSKSIESTLGSIFAPSSLEEYNNNKSIASQLYSSKVFNRLYGEDTIESLSDSDTSRYAVVKASKEKIKTTSENENADTDKAETEDSNSTKYRATVDWWANSIATNSDSMGDDTNIEPDIKLEYIFIDENSDGIIDDYTQYQLKLPDSIKIESNGEFNGYSTGRIEQSQVDNQLLDFVEAIKQEKGYKVPLYFIYGTMLVEGGITETSSLYADKMSDIYQDLMINTTGKNQYTDEDVYNGSIIKDEQVMIGPFQISSAYYDQWVSLASNDLIEKAGGDVPASITNRGTTGQPLYLPDVVLGKIENCHEAYLEADTYMRSHYKDWNDQPEEVKEFFGVMWYNIKYHGGQAGLDHAKQKSKMLDFYYDICKEVYLDNRFLSDISDWSQSSSYDNKCVQQLCQKVDPNNSKGYIEAYKNYAGEGNDTFLGDWVYAPKCLHFGLQRLEALMTNNNKG